MQKQGEQSGNERRRADRRTLDGSVRLALDAQSLTGHSGNRSKSGVYFVADGALEVLVQLSGEPEPRRGRIVRIGEMREGQLGIAVKFEDVEERD